ncbi:non-canonical purine NTP pyrophosphatase [Sutcliffiella horikoshii]|uniref:dITP/XTP pyrophosphatase n=1 Tax=Sutcliffiella horikoshii TaxID=79883 RepID=A0ABN4ZL28_9BACI|nr:XTP/dITP diphosphatase [Sutcliffiella horikoshii]ART77508.1 non-canonical purine NTP pyrophosphatase [Sutcliffiella horikoshii]
MMEIIIATNNPGKVKDFKVILEPKGFQVKSLADFPEVHDVEETGTTFEENALLKAEAVSAHLGKIVLADDSGLEVDALNGEPGVYSARYAGMEKDDRKNIQKVLDGIKGVPDEKRTARFVCVLAVVDPEGEKFTVRGTCEGTISQEPIGENGFGYDPIFYVNEKQRTMAQLSKEEKSEISHRGNAISQLTNQWEMLSRKN